MVELVKKRLKKIVGLKKEEFNELIIAKEITLTKPRLIPLFKLGDEQALTSVLLSSIKYVKEFREQVFSEAKLMKGGKLYTYTEVSFKDDPESRVDGMVIIVKGGVIKDAAILEVKNGRSSLEIEQLKRYQKLAKTYAIPKFVTISNQFVSDVTQSPIGLKSISSVDMFHFSWSYLLTIAHVLLYKNDTNIEDYDQVQIMNEVVEYLEHPKAGVFGVHQMCPEWASIVEKVNSGASLKASETEVTHAVTSWHQEEQDMSLILSRELGILVKAGQSKFKGKLDDRLKSDASNLLSKKVLESTFKVRGAASDIKVSALFDKRVVEMVVSLKAPGGKTYKGQLGWLKKQFDVCTKKSPTVFSKISNEVYVDVSLKNKRGSERFSLLDFEKIYDYAKSEEIKDFQIVFLRDFGKRFSSARKFVEIIEAMLVEYYKGIVQYLSKWEPEAPKVSKDTTVKDDESFIDEVNDGTYVDKPMLPRVNFPFG